MVTFPTATRKSAFITGTSLVVFIAALTSLEYLEVIPAGASEKELFPVVIAFFVVSVLLFVIDVKCLALTELKTRLPFVYFPTNREGLNVIFKVWGRMLFCFFGVATATLFLAFVQWLLK